MDGCTPWRTSVYLLEILSGVMSTPLTRPTSTLATASSRERQRKTLACGSETTMT